MIFPNVHDYAQSIAAKAGISIADGELFAKILTRNDDSGRHGVLIPADAYSVLPEWTPRDTTANDTRELEVFDVASGRKRVIGYKYYQRYPERRLTRLPPILNDTSSDRLFVLLSVITTSGDRVLIVDCVRRSHEQRFDEMWALLSSGSVAPEAGTFLILPLAYSGLVVDGPLSDLLGRFDAIRNQWFDSLREGDTGIGYTFETLIGVEENNDPKADFRGIELKCKRLRSSGGTAVGKVNLFQQGPVWKEPHRSAIDRVRMIGKPDGEGLFRCLSQITTQPNNLSMFLDPASQADCIILRRPDQTLGNWPHPLLERRLMEKHSRAAFVLADVRQRNNRTSYMYKELIYCERPSIKSFIEMVGRNRIVFEFLMYEKPDGTVRNRGYPWRLLNETLLDQLFSVRVKLR
jgi:hypothetical protein